MHPHLAPGLAWDDSLRLGPETSALMRLCWPPYLTDASDIPDPPLTFRIRREELSRRFPVWGIREVAGGRLLGYINGAYLQADLAAGSLPGEGWRFAIQAAAAGRVPNCLCLLVANVDPEAKGMGLGEALLERAKAAARAEGIRTVIAPVRPTRKKHFPQLTLAEFLELRTDTGAPADPWLALHQRAGGRRMNVCEESAVVRASLALWRRWTGLPLDQTGPVALAEGLGPLLVDVAKGEGLYREPNVWVRYDL